MAANAMIERRRNSGAVPSKAGAMSPAGPMSSVDIIHVIGAFAAGGAEHFVVDLTTALSRLGPSVGLLVLSSREDAAGAEMKQKLELRRIPYLCGPTHIVRLRSLLWYTNRMREIRPKIVHLHTPNTELAHFLARKVFRASHHIFRTIHSTNIRPNPLHRAAIHGNRAFLSIACCGAVEERYGPEIAGEIVTIRNGVDFDWPVQTEKQRFYHRTQLRLAHDRCHFVNVGRQSGNTLADAPKGHDVLIRSWRQAGLGSQGCELHLIGSGNLRPKLEGLAAGDGSIRFHGIRSDVRQWLLASDCFVMPSRWEGLPIAAIEALGTGLPCVFADIPSLRGLHAPLVYWSNVDDGRMLARNMRKVAEARPRVRAHETEALRVSYGIDATAKRYRECYAKASPIAAGQRLPRRSETGIV